MNFKAVDELEQFNFQDAYIDRFEVTNEQITLELEGVIVGKRNSQNERMVESYAGPIVLRLKQAHIFNLFKEGGKYYDANNVLIEEIPDEEVPEENYKDIIKSSIGEYIFALVAMTDSSLNDGRECNKPPYRYMLCVDIGEEDYWFKIEFEKSIATWEKYMNKVQ